MKKTIKNPLFSFGLLSLIVGGLAFSLGANSQNVKADGVEEITLSDCYYPGSDYSKASDGTGLSVDNDSNHWGKYDWAQNQNTIDIHFNAVVGTAESEFYVYLGNGQDEGGCIFLIQFQASGLMTYAYSCLNTFQNAFRWDSLGFTGTSNEYDIRLKVVFDATNYLADATINAINLTRNANNPKTRTVNDIALPGASHAQSFDAEDTYVRLFRRGSVHDITLYDHWNTITFQDGENVSYRKVIRNNALGELPEPQGIPGGVFDKWVDENNNPVTADLIIDRNLTIKAKYTKTYYIVTFNDDGRITSRNINIDDAIGDLPEPQGKDNYLFDKWVDSNGVEVDSNYVPSDDVTIYAKYLPKVSSDRITLKDIGVSGISNYNYQDTGYTFESGKNYIGRYNIKENDNKIDLSFDVEADKSTGSGGNQIYLRCFEEGLEQGKASVTGFKIALIYRPAINNLFVEVFDSSIEEKSAQSITFYNDTFDFIDKTFYTTRVKFGLLDEEDGSCYIQVYVGEIKVIDASFIPNIPYFNNDYIRFADCLSNPKVKDSFNTVTLIDHVNNTEDKYNGYYGLANPDIPNDVTAPSDKEGYVFSGWFNNDEQIDNTTPYSGNKVYLAKWLNEHDKKGPTIISDDLLFETGAFNNFDYNTLIYDESGSYEILKCEFSEGCLDEYDCFNEGNHTLTIEAIDMFFNKSTAVIKISVRNKYTVRFISEKEVLLSLRFYEGEIPVYTGDTPYKAKDKYNSYTFSGWDKTLTAVTGDIDYIATFKATPLDDDEKGGVEENIAPSKKNNTETIIIVTSSIVGGVALIGLVVFIIIRKRIGM